MMNKTFSQNAWEEYLSWQKEDEKVLRRINELIKAIQRTPFKVIGKPEPLKYDLTGYWSRRIDREHRLVYKYQEKELLIASCMFHYDK